MTATRGSLRSRSKLNSEETARPRRRAARRRRRRSRPPSRARRAPRASPRPRRSPDTVLPDRARMFSSSARASAVRPARDVGVRQIAVHLFGLPHRERRDARFEQRDRLRRLPHPQQRERAPRAGQHERRVHGDRDAGDRIGCGVSALEQQDLRLPRPGDQRCRLERLRASHAFVRGAVVAQSVGRAVRTTPMRWRASSRARPRVGSWPRPAPARPAASRRSPTRCTIRRSSSPSRSRAAPPPPRSSGSASCCPARRREARPAPSRATPAHGRSADRATMPARTARSPD